MANLPPDTSLLAGTPADWTIEKGVWLTPGPGVPDNGRAAKSKALFLGHAWRIENGRFMPPAGFSGGTSFTQADIDRARAEGRAEGVAAAKKALAAVV